MQSLDWNATIDRAKRMTVSELHSARLDCADTARIMGRAPMVGKDASYYRDEASVYVRELNRRGVPA